MHELDGCMFGLAGKNGKPIKKPWKMLSWNTRIGNGLSRKCDGSHDHTPCAGSETKSTQLYTPLIVKLIVDSFASHDRGVGSLRESTGVRNKKSTNAACCVRIGHWLDEESDPEPDDFSIHHALAAAQIHSCHVRRIGSYGTEELITPGEPRPAEANRKTLTAKRDCLSGIHERRRSDRRRDFPAMEREVSGSVPCGEQDYPGDLQCRRPVTEANCLH